jgi:hypothetical protein
MYKNHNMSDFVATILYPSGSHGNFLKYLLDYMSTGVTSVSLSKTYDARISLSDFNTAHNRSNVRGKCVNISVTKDMYLKYLMSMFTRTSESTNSNVELENLHIDTIAKLTKHPILRYFIDSACQICKFKNNNTTIPEIREWIRLCFFNGSYTTISDIIEPSVSNNAIYNVSFKEFYGPNLPAICTSILNTLSIPIINADIEDKIEEFKNNIEFFNIDVDIGVIKQALKQKETYYFTNLNVCKEAYIDSIITDIYHCDIDLVHPYFTNTKDLLHHYKIQ